MVQLLSICSYNVTKSEYVCQRCCIMNSFFMGIPNVFHVEELYLAFKGTLFPIVFQHHHGVTINL
jgi:hypothetical protein